ncbi:hypothetical protein [Actinomadura rubrisoli]|uniref:Tail terminator n=1 Tax=Actinomadura rubrisoli TaxID=2530368 RepID=A0A4R5CFJ0_9ACTN|nr:hypothetical protein [Actinomadura rubrisoli]TDD97170.1 hypothetical protein E1298_01675 [Actinomadura rubrisoli]
MRYNPVQLLVDYLKTQPEFAGITIAKNMTGHVTGSKRIVLSYGGGSRFVRDKADHWDIASSVHARTDDEAIPIAMTLREVLLERIPSIRLGGGRVTFADVQETNAPYDFSESVVSGEVRFLGLYTVTAYM